MGSATVIAHRMSALEQLRAGRTARRAAQLLVGLVGYGAALGLLSASTLGVPSWSVLADGLTAHFGMSFGTATNVIAVSVLVAWISPA